MPVLQQQSQFHSEYLTTRSSRIQKTKTRVHARNISQIVLFTQRVVFWRSRKTKEETTMKLLKISAAAAALLAGTALAVAQSSSTVGTGGTSAGGGTSSSSVGTGGSSAGGGKSGSTVGAAGSSASPTGMEHGKGHDKDRGKGHEMRKDKD